MAAKKSLVLNGSYNWMVMETPAVVVDLAILKRNLARAAEMSTAYGVQLRPHIKTHKSVRIAWMQIAAGAVGITASKSTEAMKFIHAGIPSVTVAYPIIERSKIGRLLKGGTDHGVAIRFVVDSPAGVRAVAEEASLVGLTVDIQLKVDVGLRRCGVDPTAPESISIARAIADRPQLRFSGILSHAGQAYRASSTAEIRQIARAERELMFSFAQALSAAGISVPMISVGCTPTVVLHDGFDGIDEIRPGNYVFMDLTQVMLGVCQYEDIALTVLATVVSCNDLYAIADAGSKILSSDRGPHGSDKVLGYGLARRLESPGSPAMGVTHLSEEHAFIAHGGNRLRIGERLQIMPNHACSVANLAGKYAVVNESGDVEYWPVDAASCVV